MESCMLGDGMHCFYVIFFVVYNSSDLANAKPLLVVTVTVGLYVML